MSRSITVTPERLEQAAQQMETMKADYKRIYNQLFSEVEGMAAAWQGKDNQTFATQIRGFEQDFQAMENLLQSYADFLNTSAKTYRNTQTEIINAARRLTN